MRTTSNREQFIPDGATKFAAKNSSAVVYISACATTGRPIAIGFHGKAQKPDFNLRFQSDERREKHVAEFFNRVSSWEARRKAEKELKPLEFKVGDMLTSSWGYECTINGFYKVIGIKGRTVELMEYDYMGVSEGSINSACYNVTAREPTGKVLKVRADNWGRGVKVSSYESAFPWNGKPKHQSDY